MCTYKCKINQFETDTYQIKTSARWSKCRYFKLWPLTCSVEFSQCFIVITVQKILPAIRCARSRNNAQDIFRWGQWNDVAKPCGCKNDTVPRHHSLLPRCFWWNQYTNVCHKHRQHTSLCHSPSTVHLHSYFLNHHWCLERQLPLNVESMDGSVTWEICCLCLWRTLVDWSHQRHLGRREWCLGIILASTWSSNIDHWSRREDVCYIPL